MMYTHVHERERERERERESEKGEGRDARVGWGARERREVRPVREKDRLTDNLRNRLRAEATGLAHLAGSLQWDSRSRSTGERQNAQH